LALYQAKLGGRDRLLMADPARCSAGGRRRGRPRFTSRPARISNFRMRNNALPYRSTRSMVDGAGSTPALPDEALATGRYPKQRRLRPQQIFNLGDRALRVSFAQEPPPLRLPMVHGFAHAVRAWACPAVLDVVEAPDSVTVHYAPEHLDRRLQDDPAGHMRAQLQALCVTPRTEPGTAHVIPVCYEPEVAQDLLAVAADRGVPVEQLIHLHTQPEYTVAALGFLPGFAYLQGLPAALHTPRRSTPRAMVPTGSVAISNEFTGVYPTASPGGWQLIGRTPVRLFDPERAAPSLLQPGDRVRFRRIALSELVQDTPC
jgi:KipI family sensor histidine kinase inhibitor